MIPFIEKIFCLKGNNTTWKQEILAGIVAFFTIVYIIAVNASIMADAGIPFSAGIMATVLSSFFGCLIMGLWANTPIILVPGMGVNALFTYTIVNSMGLSWQAALGATFLSGTLFTIVSCTRELASKIATAIPDSLNEAITVGIGFLLTFIGLQKGGIVTTSAKTFVTLGQIHDPKVLITLITLIVLLLLFVRNIRGALLLSIIFGTALSWLCGQINVSNPPPAGNLAFDYSAVGAMSFSAMTSLAFWIATFSLTLVILFENIGLLHGHLQLLEKPGKFKRSLQANAFSVILAGLLGTSPTVSTVESASGITAGGKTGLTAITTGILFLTSLFCIPFIERIPASATAPILILIGGLMMKSMQNINLQDFSEAFPAFLIITFIPMTYSIVDGIAFGFVTYPILKLITGRSNEVSSHFYLITCLFLVNFLFKFTSS